MNFDSRSMDYRLSIGRAPKVGDTGPHKACHGCSAIVPTYYSIAGEEDETPSLHFKNHTALTGSSSVPCVNSGKPVQ